MSDPVEAFTGNAPHPQEKRTDVGNVVDGGFSETEPTPDVSRTHQSSPFVSGDAAAVEGDELDDTEISEVVPEGDDEKSETEPTPESNVDPAADPATIEDAQPSS